MRCSSCRKRAVIEVCTQEKHGLRKQRRPNRSILVYRGLQRTQGPCTCLPWSTHLPSLLCGCFLWSFYNFPRIITHREGYSVFIVMTHDPLLFQVMKTPRSSRTSSSVSVSALDVRSLGGKTCQFLMVDKAKLLLIGFPFRLPWVGS